MSIQGGPDIVNDGLVMHLDAGNYRSYVSGSTTWYDLCGSGITGSLVNGPAYNTGSKGNIVFDGVNDHVRFARPTDFATSSFSVMVWVKYTVKPWKGNYSDLQIIIDNAHSCPSQCGFVMQDRPDLGGYMSFGKISPTSGCPQGAMSNTVTGDNKWHCITGVADSLYSYIYVDGVYHNSGSTAGFNPKPSITLGMWQGDNGNSQDRFLTGQIGMVQLYNKVLSANEIKQNYNATKGRFGL